MGEFVEKLGLFLCLFLVAVVAELFLVGVAGAVVVNVFVVLVGPSFKHSLAHALYIDVGQKTFESLVFALQLDKKLLSVATRLSTRPRAYVLLHPFPLFAETLQRFEKSKMLVDGPASGLANFGGHQGVLAARRLARNRVI